MELVIQIQRLVCVIQNFFIKIIIPLEVWKPKTIRSNNWCRSLTPFLQVLTTGGSERESSSAFTPIWLANKGEATAKIAFGLLQAGSSAIYFKKSIVCRQKKKTFDTIMRIIWKRSYTIKK